jgi:hypothetical protein
MWLESPTQSGPVLGDPDSKKQIYEDYACSTGGSDPQADGTAKHFLFLKLEKTTL